ncbi:phosphodiester glycosidase family protein [Actinomycetospora sp. CA-053990]|uniref:phosphodiester glycosidase family protein n=1 Tax=Actinomycetospora sp. CA-053990 TaxID=3239891 RepID=UPI003D8BC8F2
MRVAVGALPLARAGRPLPGLQATERAPSTAVGLSADGRRLWLVTVDGRQDASIGTTLAELGRLLTDLGAPVAASLDGGGSTTMVRRGRDEDLTVVNSPSADPLRAVTDALAVLPR